MIINKITNGLYRIENFIPQVTMDYVNSLINETTGWQIQTLQEDSPRRSKDGHHPIILKPFQKIVDELNYDYLCDGYTIWRDTEGFKMDLHEDNLSFCAACQIYLPGSTDGSKGTSFKLKNGEMYEFPFEANTGYFMDNDKRIMHGCPTPVKPGATRYSLYVRYQNK